MQRLEVSGAVRPIYGSLGVKRLSSELFFTFVTCIILILRKKVKAVPLQAWTGPEGSRKLMFPDYMTTAQDGGKVVSLTNRPPLPPGNAPGTHFC